MTKHSEHWANEQLAARQHYSPALQRKHERRRTIEDVLILLVSIASGLAVAALMLYAAYPKT